MHKLLETAEVAVLLERVYLYFAQPPSAEMPRPQRASLSSASFCKFLKAAHLLGDRCTSTQADLIFVKACVLCFL